MSFADFGKAVLSAAAAAAAANFMLVDLDPLLKQVIALLAVALWNRFRPAR